MDTAPSPVNNIEKVAKYIGHTDDGKREVKALVKYIHELNQVNRLNQLQIEPD